MVLSVFPFIEYIKKRITLNIDSFVKSKYDTHVLLVLSTHVARNLVKSYFVC